ncbi:MAG: ATP-binding protein [Chroococcidiopsidaceae cyanobacterium CP_BM_RX_35]|nr:ATP-binding protein [Chroococcidiopsidaceae cyanobacterium CP_BM_RX_35]
MPRLATQQGWTYGQFLPALCELEQQQSYSSRVERYLQEAGLPRSKSLASFDFTCCPSVNAAQVLNLAQDSSWLQRGENSLLFGPSGIGKTHLAAGIARSLIQLDMREL